MKTFSNARLSGRTKLPALFAVTALALLGAHAQAADLPEVTISAPKVKTVGNDIATSAPIQEVTQSARVTFDPVTLTTNSGVALLQDKVQQTAQKICESMDPLDPDDGTCVRDALKSAQPQIDAAVARAKSSANS